jgi:hypothetical protein
MFQKSDEVMLPPDSNNSTFLQGAAAGKWDRPLELLRLY